MKITTHHKYSLVQEFNIQGLPPFENVLTKRATLNPNYSFIQASALMGSSE